MPGSSENRITVNGIDLQWDACAGTCTFQGLPVAMLWIDSTLAGLMSGMASMVGPERFSLALQSAGRESVESDWQVISSYPTFRDGFAAITNVAATAGWGEWQLIEDNPEESTCRFRAFNTWEGLYQRKLNTCWGSAIVAGKFAGYCSKYFGANCWATQTSFIAKGDSFDEFTVTRSTRNVEEEIEKLLATDMATRADMAVALRRLRDVQTQLLANQEGLESQVRQRTEELTRSLAQVRTINNQLRHEVAEHTRTDEALKRNENFTRRLIEHAPMSMAIVSLDGTIEYINQKAVETFGYVHEDIPTMDEWWQKAYPDPAYRRESTERWMRYVTTALAQDKEIQRDNYRVTCKDGTLKKVCVFGVTLEDKVFVMFDDITVQALREDLLMQANAELEVRVRERTAELSDRNLSLELTTAHLRKLGSKLARVEENERRRMAQVVHDQLQQMLVAARFGLSALEQSLTNENQFAASRSVCKALDEALDESGRLVLELSPPVLREGGLIPAMEWIRQRMLNSHGLAVEVVMDEQAAAIGEDLRTAIFHAIRELLLNVIKHAGVKSTTVSIKILDESYVQVVVEDQGCGYTPSGPGQHENLDSGFGLSAVRERFESFGGCMYVESAPGQGCRVTLTAPTDQAPSPEQNPLPEVSELDASSATTPTGVITSNRIRVLLVDDHAMLRQGLAGLLSRQGNFEIAGEAADGEAAVKQARALHPDVILMDFNMPKMNGIEATRTIHAEFPDMIVIGLSMYSEPHRAEEMRQAGAAAYVIKSEATEALVATICACYGRRHPRRSGRARDDGSGA